MLDALDHRPGDLLLDPSCGDGEFLVQAIRRLEAHGDRVRLRRILPDTLLGLDSHPEAVHAARDRVSAALATHLGCRVAPRSLPIRCEDLLAASAVAPSLPDDLLPRRDGARLVVAGNPPYVEAKRLPSEMRRWLKASFPAASAGSPDLYIYFLWAALNWLRRGDALGLVLPNRVLVNQGALQVRRRLLDEGLLSGIDSASQSRLFNGAAVYPVVLYAGRDAGPAVRVRRLEGDASALVARSSTLVERSSFSHTRLLAFWLPPADPHAAGALSRMLHDPGLSRLGDLLAIKWSISFHRAGLREQYVTPYWPDDARARPWLGGGAFSGNGEVTRYGVKWAGWWVRYDEEELAARGNQVPPVALFEQPKIAICQYGRTLRAALETGRHVLKDTFLCGVAPPGGATPADLAYLVGLLNSRTAHFCYSHLFHGGHVGSGYLHFLASFLNDLPAGAWSETARVRCGRLVTERQDCDGACGAAIEDEIERHCRQALGVCETEGRAIDAWCSTDPNWLLRERVRPAAQVSGHVSV